jgi:NAD(P)H-hydrate epimerase
VPPARSSEPPPLPGLTPLFDAAAMRAADRAAGALGMPSILLMERAGLATAQEILRRYPDRRDALVVVGSGNNGGDGLVVARHLAEAGWAVEVAAPEGRRPGAADAATMAGIAEALGLPVGALGAGAAADGRLLVDGLLGTGASGAPRGAVGDAVAALEGARGPVVSLDVPSGVDADTGRVPGTAVRAALTVTYHGDMPGLRIEPGRTHAGRVVVADIGIPSTVTAAPAAWLAGPGAVGAMPGKAAEADKYRAGAVLVVAGAPGLTGAGCLAARATLRAGGGLTVVAAPAAVQALMAAHLLEVMVAPVPDEAGHLTETSTDEVVRQAGRVGALALGPGLGRAEGTTAFVRAALETVRLPAVVDADGLWHLGERPGWLSGRGAPTIITPHAGEAARLLGRERAEVEAERLAAARELAAVTGAVAVLKGSGTVTAAPDGRTVVNATGSSALASAGTGDVLTGVVAAALAKGLEPLVAAAAAVALHGRAAELAGRGAGTIAGDVVEALPAALRPT